MFTAFISDVSYLLASSSFERSLVDCRPQMKTQTLELVNGELLQFKIFALSNDKSGIRNKIDGVTVYELESIKALAEQGLQFCHDVVKRETTWVG